MILISQIDYLLLFSLPIILVSTFVIITQNIGQMFTKYSHYKTTAPRIALGAVYKVIRWEEEVVPTGEFLLHILFLISH